MLRPLVPLHRGHYAHLDLPFLPILGFVHYGLASRPLDRTQDPLRYCLHPGFGPKE